MAWLLSLLLPKRKIAYFSSFFGQYNDNPKYISEKLHEINPDIPIYWVKSKRNREAFPSYIKTVDINSFKHYLLMFTAKVTVDNQLGMRSFPVNGLLKQKLTKLISNSPHQLNIGTWHGTPLKKIGADSLDYVRNERVIKSIKYTLSGCQHTESCLKSAFEFKNNEIKQYGTPRNDIFFKKINRTVVCNKLAIPSNKKILLFAPTFRGDINLSGLQQIQEINWIKVGDILKEKFGGEWCLVVRVHPHVQNDVLFDSNEGFINGNIGDDMAEYLSIADILITDYSSSLFDFILSKKPVFLYAPDISSYSNEERGLYFNYDKLSLPTAYNVNDLYYRIQEFDSKEYISQTEIFLTEIIGNYEDGQASLRVAKDIDCYINK